MSDAPRPCAPPCATRCPWPVTGASCWKESSTCHHPRLVKPYHYAPAGIHFYWRLELDPTVTVSIYRTGPTGRFARIEGCFGWSADGAIRG